MGLRELVVRAATTRPRVLLVEMPGGAPVRMTVEHELDARGWQIGGSAASADVLLKAGQPAPSSPRTYLLL